MLTTAAPPWLRRSDQAVIWARTMLLPGRAVIHCETKDLPVGNIAPARTPASVSGVQRGVGWMFGLTWNVLSGS
jgi:hypothetical protein